MTKNTRGPLYAGYRLTIPADLTTPAAVAAVLDSQRTVHDYGIGLHDRDKVAPHVQSAWLCPTRVALPEMHQRLSRGLDLATDLIDLDPLIAGRGRSARDALLGFLAYLPHDDAEQQARGKAVYSRDSILVSDPGLWAQVDTWRERQARKLKAARPLSAVETIELLLMYGYTELEDVKHTEQSLWPKHHARFIRAAAEVRRELKAISAGGEPATLSDELWARMPADLVERLCGE